MYLRIYRDRRILRRVDTGKQLERQAVSPFTSERLLIGNFPEASDLLNAVLVEINDRVGIVSKKTRLVVHPMEMTEGGLSAVEQRAFTDLGEFSGAKPVIIVTEQEVLDDAQVLRYLEAQVRA